MDTQTPTKEGEELGNQPTPEAGMQPQDQAPKADPVKEAKPSELKVIEEATGRDFGGNIDEAKKYLTNLNSLVGDQTVAKQRKALEKLAQQANLTPNELLEVIETQNIQVPTEQPAPEAPRTPDPSVSRLTRLEVNDLIAKQPDAESIKDTLFAEALATGKPVEEIWNAKYAPVMEAGKKLGAKKLQQTKEGQPLKGTSNASEADITLDPRQMTREQLEKVLPKGQGF
jgi:hypothetical protein